MAPKRGQKRAQGSSKIHSLAQDIVGFPSNGFTRDFFLVEFLQQPFEAGRAEGCWEAQAKVVKRLAGRGRR